MDLIIKVLINAAVLYGAAYILSGVEIKDAIRAIITAIVIALLNSTVGKIMDFFATPVTWLTLGLFTFVIDAIVIMIADYFLKGFQVKNFIWAVILAVILSVANSVLGLGGFLT